MIRPIWYLKNFSLFKELPHSELLDLERMTTMTHPRKGETVFLPGDPSDTLYLLKKGIIQISRPLPAGKEISLAILRPGELFGELALSEETQRDCIARCLDDSILCIVPKQHFESFLRTHPNLALRIIKLLGFRRRQIEAKIEDLVFKDVRSRLAKVLLDLAKEFGKESDEGRAIIFRLTHKNLASLVGSSRETVSALIGEWKHTGILNPATRRICILDESKLREIAIHRTGSA